MPDLEPLARPAPPPIDSPEAILAYERSLDCIHCGLCLPKCPTYLLTGSEPSSPRGRIYLMRAWAEGRVGGTARFDEEMNFCLVCRACETVCPAGVRFGEMMEFTRGELAKARPARGAAGFFKRLLLRKLLVDRKWLDDALGLLRLYSFRPVRALVRPLLPRRLRERDLLLPSVPPRSARRPLPDLTPAAGTKRGRVAVLRGCVMEPLLPEATRATVDVLARNGFEVAAPAEPACCGALHAHFGEVERAAGLARAWIAAFESSGAEAMVVNSAGCGSAMKEYGRLLAREPAWKDRAAAFSAQVRDVSEFLVERGFEKPKGKIHARVAYADACHLLHGQRISEPPREILRAVPGVTLVPLPESDLCCGAAGIYSLTNFEASKALLDRKVAAIRRVGPDFVASANPGCLLQIRAGLRAVGLAVPAVHPVELLARAYANPA